MNDQDDAEILVLHVDDDAEFLDLSRTFLSRRDDLSVETETDVEAATERVRDGDVDCVLSDYDMPDTDGLTFLSTVRDTHPDLPFILYTGKGSEEVASEAITAGVTDYLQKEVGTEQYTILANRIRNAVEQHRARREANRTESQLRQMLERITDAFFALDEELNITYANRKAADHVGMSVSDVVGRSINEFTTENEDARDAYERALEEQTPVTVETPTALHEDRWIEIRAYPSDDGLSVYFRDVTDRRLREQSLRERAERFEAIFDRHSVPMLLVDPETGAIQNANHAATSFYGYDDETLTSMTIDDVNALSEDEVRRHRRQASDRERNRFVFPHRLADGSIRIVEVFSTPIRVAESEVLFSIVHDVTERRERREQLEEERDRFAALFESVPESVVHIAYEDDVAVVKNVNSTFESVFGYEAGDIEGESLDSFVVPDDPPDGSEAVDARVTGDEVFEREVTRATASGLREFKLRVRAIDLEGEFRESIGIYTDIAEQKRRERELRRQNERLERFASVVSHDLRNPLSVARGNLDLHAEACESDELTYARDALKRMDAMVDDLLTLAREGDSVGDREPVSLETLALESWRTVDTPRASLTVEEDAEFDADSGRARTLFENLFRNAVEHGSRGGRTDVDATDDVEQSLTVRVGAMDDGFYVADDGVGIPADRRPDVFEVGHTTQDDGTGYGLAIVRDVARAHGWDVSLVESDGGGLRVEITDVTLRDT